MQNKMLHFILSHFYNHCMNLIITHILAQCSLTETWYISKKNEKGIYRHFVQVIFSSIDTKKIKVSKKNMNGRFNRFLSSLNALLHTPQQLYTNHYAFMVYHVSLHNKSYYTYLSNTDAHHYISTDVLYDSSTD